MVVKSMHYTAKFGNVAMTIQSGQDYAMATLAGAEVYQLTYKRNGAISIAAFDSPIAAKRFFAGNSDYFFTKIF